MADYENVLLPEDAVQFVNSMYIMAILNQEGRYVYVNPGWFEHNKVIREPGKPPVSLEPGDILGRKVWDIVPDSKAAYVLEHGVPIVGEPVEGGNTFTTYLPRYTQDGRPNGCYLYTIIGNLDEAAAVGKRLSDAIQESNFFKLELAHERGAKYNLNSLVGESPAMTQVRNQIRMAARVPSSVLIEGETGTGKELIAHAIHSESVRAIGNFVRVNCAAIPPELMESEFFGYVPGAFTGASRQGKRGRFAFADGGSIFLDEVNLLPPTMQPKFLRVLQEREISPVGSEETIPVDVRVIAASNLSLNQQIREGKFREDLYFRLNVINITAPPLRKRKEDIPALVDVFIDRLNHQLGMMVQGVDSRVLQLLQEYDWPGNIRELQNSIERAMSMTTASVLTLQQFDTLMVRVRRGWTMGLSDTPGVRTDLRAVREEAEKKAILDTLALNQGNRTQTAQELGISRAELYRKLGRYGIGEK